jgi:2-methylcitrate dehydratase PrpD
MAERSYTARSAARRSKWYIVKQGLNIKRYPICYATHRSIDAALDLVARHDLSPSQVNHIEVCTGKTQLLMLRNNRPQTALEAKFSMEFAMAAALVARKVGLAELTDDFVLRPDVQAIFPCVSFSATDETMEGSAFAPADEVVITTKAGDTLNSGPTAYAKGSHQRPLSRDELWTKFADCLGAEFPASTKAQTFDKLMALQRSNGPADLTQSLQ